MHSFTHSFIPPSGVWEGLSGPRWRERRTETVPKAWAPLGVGWSKSLPPDRKARPALASLT